VIDERHNSWTFDDERGKREQQSLRLFTQSSLGWVRTIVVDFAHCNGAFASTLAGEGFSEISATCSPALTRLYQAPHINAFFYIVHNYRYS
jgi:hypothetical protein